MRGVTMRSAFRLATSTSISTAGVLSSEIVAITVLSSRLKTVVPAPVPALQALGEGL